MPQCANSCGRFAAEGFSTCCRSCGTGKHGAICEAAQQVLNQPDPKPRCACGRFASVGYSTCCKDCGTGKHGRTCDTVEIARKAWVAAAGKAVAGGALAAGTGACWQTSEGDFWPRKWQDLPA